MNEITKEILIYSITEYEDRRMSTLGSIKYLTDMYGQTSEDVTYLKERLLKIEDTIRQLKEDVYYKNHMKLLEGLED